MCGGLGLGTGTGGLAATRQEETFGDVGSILKLFTRLYTFTRNH